MARKLTRKGLWKKLWDRQSKEIRQSAANFQDLVQCYTCSAWIHWKEAQVGHYWHNKLDFDKRNLKIQCVHCNHYLRGNLGVYGVRLVRDFGQEWYDELEKDKNRFKGYTFSDLKQLEKTI